MTCPIFDDKRLKVLDLLPKNWVETIEKSYLKDGFEPMSIWPDEADIYAGTDKEALTAIKKHKLSSKNIEDLLS